MDALSGLGTEERAAMLYSLSCSFPCPLTKATRGCPLPNLPPQAGEGTGWAEVS